MSLNQLLADPAEARRALDRGEAGVVELTRAALERAAELQPAIGAFSEIAYELAHEQAERAQESLRSGGARSPLHGLPLAVKDVIDVAGVPTRLGTPRAGHRVPSASAAAVDALVAAGAVVMGKAATHELAYGMITPRARNPRDTSRITGGSSGGSAAAVAAGIAALALGTDTNGSVRCPAAHCGVVGLKPTRGAIPRAGVAPLAWTQDTVGVLAPSVEVARQAWAVLDPRPAKRPTAETRRVGVDRAACETADPEVAAAVTAALDALGADGIELVEVQPPDHGLAGAASVLAIVAEAGEAWAAELEADPAGFGPRVRAALRAGREIPREAYLNAKRVRARICAGMRELFTQHALDALALPTVPLTATPGELERVTFRGRERAVESLQSQFTALASLTGQPALSLPCGRDRDGLPVGLQLLGRAGGEAQLLDLAGRVAALLPMDGSFV